VNPELIGVLIGAAGLLVAVFSLWWAHHQTRRSSRRRIGFSVETSYELDPSSFTPDLSRVLRLEFAGRTISNLTVLKLEVTNEGVHDYVDPSARTVPGTRDPDRPQIVFDNLRVVSIGTRNNDRNVFDIPITQPTTPDRITINIVRLVSGGKAEFNILGERLNLAQPVGMAFRPGRLLDTDVVPGGQLANNVLS